MAPNKVAATFGFTNKINLENTLDIVTPNRNDLDESWRGQRFPEKPKGINTDAKQSTTKTRYT